MKKISARIIKKIKKTARKIFDLYFIVKYYFIKDSIRIKNIISIEETIRLLVETNASISRFGDGEFKWITGNHKKNETFQENSEELAIRLKEVLESKSMNHFVAISPAFKNLSYCADESKKYWKTALAKHGSSWYSILDKNRTYYNANITRFYSGDINKSLSKYRFELLKKIWENKEVLIVEGEMSRLGIGNDLFEKSKNIQRLLAPSKNAFSEYEEILKKTIEYGKNKLILIALGPTATVLAYDLSKYGYQAIDIGHVDLEYEWFLKKATHKTSIKGKIVNEVEDDYIREFDENIIEMYSNQVVDSIN